MTDTHAPPLTRPIPDSYVVPGTRLAAGEYPGSRPETTESKATARLNGFLDAGISAFVDLTAPADPLDAYAPALLALAKARGIDVVYERLAIRDMSVCDAGHMHRVLDTLDAHLAEGRGVYTHCWGGIGRTGMVVGCWLVRHGRTGEEALAEVDRLFRSMSADKVAAHRAWGSPQTGAQREVVRRWAEHERSVRRDA